MKRWPAAITLLLVAGGCGHAAPSPRLALERRGDTTLLRLLVADSQEVNARIPPALELRDGRILRFGGAPLTADSSYYTAPPVARLTPATDTIHGTLRAGICNRGERFCRTVTLEL